MRRVEVQNEAIVAFVGYEEVRTAADYKPA
jgi:hypothetical protein